MSKKDKIASDLRGIINSKNVLSSLDELRPFETDGLTAYRQMPLLVVMPETVEEVSQILKYCNENKIKVVPRGAGTGLSGGSMPLEDCVLIAIKSLKSITKIDVW
jgi:glycolate oxidase